MHTPSHQIIIQSYRWALGCWGVFCFLRFFSRNHTNHHNVHCKTQCIVVQYNYCLKIWKRETREKEVLLLFMGEEPLRLKYLGQKASSELHASSKNKYGKLRARVIEILHRRCRSSCQHQPCCDSVFFHSLHLRSYAGWLWGTFSSSFSLNCKRLALFKTRLIIFVSWNLSHKNQQLVKASPHPPGMLPSLNEFVSVQHKCFFLSFAGRNEKAK